MNEEDKIHINSFKFYDRDELEDLTKKYYLENKKLKMLLNEFLKEDKQRKQDRINNVIDIQLEMECLDDEC